MRDTLAGFRVRPGLPHPYRERPDAPDACGMGFIASRRGVAERGLVDLALELCRQFDHRGAPGHGAGVMLDIPWALLLDRFPEHARVLAQRDVAVGVFFLPYEAEARRHCVATVEEFAGLVGSRVLGWCDVPLDIDALPPGAGARRTVPVVRQALFQRPAGLGEEGWLACRYLLRLALDEVLGDESGFEFSICSLSNRTIVYKGLAELSRIGQLYPDLCHPHLASRFVLFHSRYCTNTTTAWRRAQPFWGLAHNGEISTIRGNVAWMRAIGPDLLKHLVARHAQLAPLAGRVRSVICSGGSDTANLDDMLLALYTGGLSLSQSLLALLPEAPAAARGDAGAQAFHEAMGVFLGACDGPAALVACDGDEAVAHLDRNGLRPLWLLVTREHAIAASELTGTLGALGPIEQQRLFGPGDTVAVRLSNGEVLLTEDVRRLAGQQHFPVPRQVVSVPPASSATSPVPPTAAQLRRLQRAFGMSQEDIDVLLAPLARDGKAALGSMGDDTPPAALLDSQPRRLEDHFKLRFAQETSPPIDPLRDAWVFETSVALGDRSGLWSEGGGPVYRLPERVLAPADLEQLCAFEGVVRLDVCFDATRGAAGIGPALAELVRVGLARARSASVLVLSDRAVGVDRAPLPALRAISRLHTALVEAGLRHRVGLVADVGVWDIQPVALHVALGADAVCPWLGCLTLAADESTYLKGLRAGLLEAMSMMGVTPASAYCGARLIESVGLAPDFVAAEFEGVAAHLGGLGPETLDAEWFALFQEGFRPGEAARLPDLGEFRYRRGGRPHSHGPDTIKVLHRAAGHGHADGDREAYDRFAQAVNERPPLAVLDLLEPQALGPAVPLDQVESEQHLVWRFMAPGMSEGALSEPAHRAVARAMNVLWRWCRLSFRLRGEALPDGIGPFANSGEGGFDKRRMGGRDGNRSIQYAGARFTITPATAARAHEAEVKFAQGAKPGKGGQLPGRKVSARIAQQRGCEPGFELVSPPVNHNLYSIEDVKLMLESWRALNPEVSCALKFVATQGVELAAMGGVNAGANRLHISDGCGGTGAAKRVDQKHAGLPAAIALPAVHDQLLEEGVRELVELSVDGGVQTGAQVLKLLLLGADRVAFGTSVLVALGCSMLRQCHLAGPQPGDATGRRRLGCSVGVATQDPALVARFKGRGRDVVKYLRFVAQELRECMAALGIRRLDEVVGRRDLLRPRPALAGKAARLDLAYLTSAPPRRKGPSRLSEQARRHAPADRSAEHQGAQRATAGEELELRAALTNSDRCVGVAAAGELARRFGDQGLPAGRLTFRHTGAAGHYYAAYAVFGMEFYLQGLVADSCFTAAYGGKLVVVPEGGDHRLTLVGNTFGYGARAGRAYVAGRGGNRFGICLRKSHEGGGPRVVVEGVEANGFQYMTGGSALVLGPTGHNLASGLTGGRLYVLDLDPARLNPLARAQALDDEDASIVLSLLQEHVIETASRPAERLLLDFDAGRFSRVVTGLVAEPLESELGTTATSGTDLSPIAGRGSV